MFATIFYERDPLKLSDLPSSLQAYVINAGFLVGVLIVAWLAIASRDSKKRLLSEMPPWLRLTCKLVLALGVIAYLVFLTMLVLESTAMGMGRYRRAMGQIAVNSATLGGACALAVALIPFCSNIVRFRARRIWGLAKLSFKEAIRRKVLWVFLALLLVLMFASWFIQSKSEDQVRTYVQVVSFSMSVLLLLVAALLASFGIPTDMKQQTIHTILTKPVERFEVVLGRFLGYMALLTLVLIAVSGVSLLYVLRGIDPDAAYESLKARETAYGELEFEGTKDRNRGTNVGKEWEYRTYIFGPEPQQPTQWAVWKFSDLKPLADRKKIRCEFSFDIYRTTKGRIGEGVFCTFFVQTAGFDPSQKTAYDNERSKERQKPGANFDEIDNRLAEKYGCYELASKEIRNLHTYDLDIPGGIIQHALKSAGERPTSTSPLQAERPPLAIKVRCDSRTQYVGVAKYDLYLRPDYDYDLSDAETFRRDRRLFMWNFFKGQSGLWFRLCLVVGLCVALSTFLSGVITFLSTAFLYLGGLSREFIRGIAEGTGVTGGPFEAGYRLALRDLGTQLEETAAMRVVTYSDDAYRFVVRLFMNVLPDVDHFDLSMNVAEGFNIPAAQLAMTALVLLGYMLLCALGAYYLMKSREIASSM